MSTEASTTAWQQEPKPLAESRFTPRAGPEWHAWNGWSPELELCEFLASLVSMLRPREVVETGTGQGFATRRIAARLQDGQRLVCYESSAEWRTHLRSLPFFDGEHRVLSSAETPDDDALSRAECCFLDSDFAFRQLEIRRWWHSAPGGAVIVIHDAGLDHAAETPHAVVRETIRELGIPGSFLANPRGAFLGVKPATHDGTDASRGALELANRVAAAEAELRSLRASRTFRYTAAPRRLYAALRRRRGNQPELPPSR